MSARERTAVSAEVRSALVGTLYASPVSLTMGALCGVLTAFFVAVQADTQSLWLCAWLLAAIVVGRIWSAFAFARADSCGPARARQLELIYEAGAWAYAVMFGLTAAVTLVSDVDARLDALIAANCIGYAGGIAARNAGRPVLAVGQTLLVSLPVIIGALIEGSAAYAVFAMTISLFAVAMVGITFNTYDIVHASFASAHRNAQLAADMRTFATTDAVTGLANRTGLEDWFATSFRGDIVPRMALFWFDLDRFKEVNDTLGHPVGDRLLTAVAERIGAVCPPDSIVCRFGGDEFVICCPDIGRTEADAFGKMLLTIIAQPITIDNAVLNISASLGIALCPDDGQTPAAVMKQADMALYAAKVGGRGQQHFFVADMDHQLTRRRELENELRAAVRNRELQVHYQPIIDLGTGEVAAMEALVRWYHPVRGPLRPDEFIAIAEQTGLVITMGNWITLEACRTAAHWPEHIKIAVNVSPVQMQAPGAALGFINAVRTSGISPGRLELEITENVFADKTDNVVEFIRMVRNAGIGLTLDDFGTGYSSLSYIRDFDFSKIKIDRTFISGLQPGDRSSEIVKAVAELARRLDMPVVAEGIETDADAALAHALGCSHGQGFRYSAAVPADQAAGLLQGPMARPLAA